MNVLFVASGNTKEGISPIIKSQGESLKKLDITVQYFPIEGGGLRGYLRGALKLRKYLKNNFIDIIHAHYTLSGWSALLSLSKKPLILSLMGDDANGTYIDKSKIKFKSRYLKLLTFFIQPFVQAIISKSSNIERIVYRKGISYIIPNGVNINIFNIHSNGFRKELGLESEKKYILFLADHKLPVKNYSLVQNAVDRINETHLEVLSPFPVAHEDVVKYLNSADVFVLSSFMEGSPNVIKEAMACSRPIVSTPVGDVDWVLGDTEGCYLASFDPSDFADKIKKSLLFAEQKGKTEGRKRILALGLDSESVAKRIIEVYEKVLS